MEKTLYRYTELPPECAAARADEREQYLEFIEQHYHWNDAYLNFNYGGCSIIFAPLVGLTRYCS